MGKNFVSTNVKYIKLKNLEEKHIISLGRGQVISKKDMQDMPGDYPVYSSSATNNGIIGKYGKYMFDDERLTWSIDGGGKFFYRNSEKYSVTNVCGWLKVSDKRVLNTRYLYYALTNEWVKKRFDYVHKAHPSVIRKEYTIPVPSIEIQNEIVHILDKFTTLEAELEAELEARKKQYEFYRNRLLDFSGEREAQWSTIDEIFELRNGYTPSKSNSTFWDNGSIPWVRMEDIRQNGRMLSDSIQHITPAAVKGKGLFHTNSIIMATTATIGEHAMLTADLLANQQFTNFKIRKPLENKLMPKFVFYYFFLIDDWCINNTNVSSFPSVDISRLKKIKFPIPPVKTQEKIISILDNFYKLSHSLSAGLPAEIAARRKQYEYYRNKLLSFSEEK